MRTGRPEHTLAPRVPITYDPRPTFLIHRTLAWLGAPRPSRTLALSGTDLDDTIRDDRLLDAWWTELEGLIVALNLAGYECPELIVAHRDQPTGWLRLPVWIGLEDEWDPEDPLVIVGDGDWRTLTGVSPDVVPAAATRLTLLRVEVRRTVDTPVRKAEERPPRFPPIPLDGLVPGFRPGPPGSTDPFADPLDGWIAFGHLAAAAGESGALKTAQDMGTLADDTRDLLVDALVAEWQRAKPADVGILRYLDPATWDSPLDRAAWVWPFDVLWGEIWARADAASGTQLRAWLKEPTDSKDVSLRELAAATSWGGSGDAVAALRDRGERLGVTDESLELVLAQLPSRHWLLGLFMLHESSLVRLLPFPVAHEPEIKFIDLTGWYETTYADAGRPVNAAMQLNHAGHRLVGWFQDSDLNRWDFELQRVSFDPDGREPLAYAGSFTGASGSVDGTITQVPRADPDEVNVVVAFGRQYVLTRRHRHSLTPPPTIVAAMGQTAPDGLELKILPLHSYAQRRVEEASDLLITRLLEMKAFGTDPASWDTTVDALERSMRDILDDGGVLRFGNEMQGGAVVNPVEETPMLERFRLEAQKRLAATEVKSGEAGDGISQLRDILHHIDEEDALPSVEQLQELVGLGPLGHAYSFVMGELGGELELEAAGFVAGGTAWTPTAMWHLPDCAPDGDTNHGWFEAYLGAMGMGGAGVGPEMKLQLKFFTISTANDVSTILDWGPEDFVPSIFVCGETAVEVSAYPGAGLKGPVGVLGGGESEGWMFFTPRGVASGVGDGGFLSLALGVAAAPPMFGPFNIAWSILGVKMGVLFARLGLADPGPDPEPPAPPPAPFPLTMRVERISSYGFDESELSDGAKEELAVIVARHRQLFEWPHSRIQIEGDASPEGTGPYNDLLSWKRALSVYTHVMALLSAPASPSSDPASDYDPTNALAVRHSNVQLVGHGEARSAADERGLTDPEDFRRAALVINGQVTVFV